MLLNMDVMDSGDLLSSMMRLRRMSKMMPIGLMLIGQASTQAWQLVHAQSSSSVIQSPHTGFASG